jgi:hypothetical protein
VLHPWLKQELTKILAQLPEPPAGLDPCDDSRTMGALAGSSTEMTRTALIMGN